MNKYSGGGEHNIEETNVRFGGIRVKKKSKVSGRSESSKPTERLFQSMEGPQTYKFLAPRDTVCAAVNIVAISRNMRSYLDHPPYTFSSRIDLCRDVGKSYRMCIIPSNEKTPTFRDLCDLTSVVKKKKNCLFASFSKDFWVHVHFDQSVQFKYFFKMMCEIVKISEKSNRDAETPNEIRGMYHPRQISTYKVPAKAKKSIVSRLSSPLSITTDEKNGTMQFFEISAEDWLPPQFEDFLKHVYVQGAGQRRVMTLFEYMGSVDENMYPDLLHYFQGGRNDGDNNNNKNPNNNNNDENNDEPRNYSSLRREIENFEKDPETCDEHLRKVLEEDLVLETLKDECNKLRCRDGLFDINFFLVLRKRVHQLRNVIENGTQNLRRIVDDLNTVHRYWWNVEDCRDHILSLLLYRKNFIQFTRQQELEFFKLEKKTFEDKVASTGDVSWMSDKKHVLIDPDEWKAMLHSFNRKIGISMEDISFRVRIAHEQNELRVRLKDLQDEEQVERLEDELAKLTTRIKLKKEQYEKMDNSIMDLIGEESKEASAKLEKLEARMKGIELEIGDLTSNYKDLEREIRKLKAQKNEEGIKDLKREIVFRKPENFMKRFLPFYAAEKRREVIRRHFLEHIDWLSGKGMSEFGVKLVISILKDHEPEAWQQRVLSVIDKFYTPSFYKWGFIHANCQVANVGCHWFSSSLVVMTDLAVGKNYEELIAIDCCCPLIVNYHTIFERLTSFAELIVSSNVNYQYSVTNIAKKDGFMNCQEFANKLIKALDYTKFFSTVNLYLEALRNELTKAEKQTSRNMRFLTVTERFSEMYGKAWEGRLRNRFSPDKKSRIYFNSHDDVDTFYNACVGVNQEGADAMDLKFPGEFQLLKGFDRAFWMTAKLGKNRKSDCPFLDVHGSEGELIKQRLKKKLSPDEIFDLEEKEEEENEGEEGD